MAVNGGKSAEIEEETWSDINVILQKNAEDNMTEHVSNEEALETREKRTLRDS